MDGKQGKGKESSSSGLSSHVGTATLLSGAHGLIHLFFFLNGAKKRGQKRRK